jgi:hypothetical protein
MAAGQRPGNYSIYRRKKMLSKVIYLKTQKVNKKSIVPQIRSGNFRVLNSNRLKDITDNA